MVNKEILIEQYTKSMLKKYMQFMNIDNNDMPDVKIYIHNFNEKELKKGFVSLAKQDYDISNDKYSITINDIVKLSDPYLSSLLFHEFTHIFDTYKYVSGDKNRNAGIKGYTEFHAAQIELIHMLENERECTISSFSMNDEIETIYGKQSVKEYLFSRINSASEICGRTDFPHDIATLSTVYGIVYNCWGIEDICRRYATDYREADFNVSNSVKQVFNGVFDVLNKYFKEVEPVDVNLLIEFHQKMIISSVQKYKLS
ncbi:hypothetical protein [Lachnobacterium bovis]|uniref:hypothetical protein n=1 Tax=Lachnobacterium bovis TaxID=140626 RepID=UPI00048F38F2|nr:hypothetical protein [Lachnobacterium bovis]